jgi:hypothetical protein
LDRWDIGGEPESIAGGAGDTWNLGGQHRAEGRGGERNLTDDVIEDHTTLGECIDVRRRGQGVAVATEMIGAQRVDGNEKNIRRGHEGRSKQR